MKLLICAGMFALVLLCPLTASAAEALGYAYVAPGVVKVQSNHGGTFQLGAGAEGVFGHVGFGAELGYLTVNEGNFASGVGVFSPNGYYHIFRLKNVDPYLTGGYTLYFRGGHENLFNFGGGANWWLRPKIGLKFEIRDQMEPRFSYSTHYIGFRFGVVFR